MSEGAKVKATGRKPTAAMGFAARTRPHTSCISALQKHAGQPRSATRFQGRLRLAAVRLYEFESGHESEQLDDDCDRRRGKADVDAGGPGSNWETLPLADARSSGSDDAVRRKVPRPRSAWFRWARSLREARPRNFAAALTCRATAEVVEAFEIISEEGVSAGTRRIIAADRSRKCD